MYEVWVHTPDYAQRTAIVCEAGGDRQGWVFSRLIIPRRENQVTEAVLAMPYQPGIVELFPLDTRLEFYDDGRLELETQWFVRVPPKLTYDDDGAMLVEVRAECALYLLAGRIVAYAAGAPQTVKSGPADDLIKAVVRENLGALASADRDLSDHLDVAADTGQGATIYKTITRQNVLLVCQKIARASSQAGVPVFFDVVWNGSRLELRTYAWQRGAARPVVLAASFGTLAEASRAFDHRDEATVVYCAGQGQGDERLIVSVSDDARRTATPFNRRELFVDARYLSLTQSVATEADATLWRRRPVQQLGGVAIDTPQVVYGYTWGWGDLLLSEDRGQSFPVRAYGVEIQVTPGSRRVVVELRADSSEADDAVRRIEGQLDQGASDELPIFTAMPAGGAVPIADGEGHIADGWLADTIARAADIPAALPPTAHAASHRQGGSDEIATAAPAPNAIPKAGVDSTIDDGWLSAAIARVADRTWANIANKPATFTPAPHAHPWDEITGKPATFASDWTLVANKPATFAPSAHAASHKHGGADEIATATPAAHAIPKADSAGWLDAWLSTAVARLGVAQTWTAKQTLADVEVKGSLSVGAVGPGALAFLEFGAFGSGNRYAYLDFIGDDTYADFGLRFIRHNGGPNTLSEIVHRGTGALQLTAYDGGAVAVATGNTERARISAGGALLVGLASGLNSPGQLHLASGAAVALRIDGAGNIATTAGASTGKYLVLSLGGTQYKIALLNS